MLGRPSERVVQSANGLADASREVAIAVCAFDSAATRGRAATASDRFLEPVRYLPPVVARA